MADADDDPAVYERRVTALAALSRQRISALTGS
jgi:hypothetical protein